MLIIYKRSLVLFLLAILLSFQYNCESTTQPNLIDKAVVSTDSFEKEYLNRFFIESLSNNNKIKKNISVLKGGYSATLKSILDGKQHLVIEYSPLSCSLCVDSLFTYINKSKLNKDLIIVTGTKNRNLVELELSKYSLNGSIISVPLTPEAIKEVNTDPKIYLLDPDMTVHHYITINKAMVKYLKLYIKLLEVNN